MPFRLKKLAYFLFCAAVAVAMANFLRTAWTEQHIPLPGRGGLGRNVTLIEAPAMFWTSVVVIVIFLLGTLIGAGIALWELVTGEEVG